MLKIALLVHVVVMPTLMGLCVMALLIVDQAARPGAVIAAVIAGAVLSFPASYLISKRLTRLTRTST